MPNSWPPTNQPNLNLDTPQYTHGSQLSRTGQALVPGPGRHERQVLGNMARRRETCCKLLNIKKDRQHNINKFRIQIDFSYWRVFSIRRSTVSGKHWSCVATPRPNDIFNFGLRHLQERSSSGNPLLSVFNAIFYSELKSQFIFWFKPTVINDFQSPGHLEIPYHYLCHLVRLLLYASCLTTHCTLHLKA